jgi:pyruvate kinase
MRPKIICTIGPASDELKTLKAMLKAGMDIARLNLSHGTHAYKREVFNKLRELGEVSILFDLPGPKIRLGELDGSIILKQKDQVHFTTQKVMGNNKEIPITYKNLPKEVHSGDSIFINDGNIEVKIDRIDDDFEGFFGNIIFGGEIVSHKGLNAPFATISIRPPTEKDVNGIKLGIDLDVDWFAISFIRNKMDVENTQKIIKQLGGDQPIISKIEHREAIKNIDEIITASDGIMVARGDLGIEMPRWEVPILQKQIIKKCHNAGKPVIVATQMLSSMVMSPQPTRAEVSDVSNAILDGVDAVMLSEETAVGLHPIRSVKMMKNIYQTTIKEIPPHRLEKPAKGISRADIIGSLIPWVTDAVKPGAILIITRSGFTARMISKHRPKARIFAITRNSWVARRIRFYWGVELLDVHWTNDRNELLKRAIQRSLEKKVVNRKDTLIIVSGSALESTRTTSTFEIIKIENVLKNI